MNKAKRANRETRKKAGCQIQTYIQYNRLKALEVMVWALSSHDHHESSGLFLRG